MMLCMTSCGVLHEDVFDIGVHHELLLNRIHSSSFIHRGLPGRVTESWYFDFADIESRSQPARAAPSSALYLRHTGRPGGQPGHL